MNPQDVLPAADGHPPAPAGDIALARALRQALALRGEGWTLKDVETGRYLDAAPEFRRLVASSLATLEGRGDADLFEPAAVAALRAADQAALAAPQGLQSDHQLTLSDGRRRSFRVVRVACRRGSQPGLLALWRDVTDTSALESQLQAALAQIEQQQQAQARLQREVAELAALDPVSGLHNRGSFDEHLRRELDLSVREHREFALVSIEVDLPEALAPEARERVLQAMGRLLKGGTRAMDASARLDGPRFCVLLSGVGLATAHARMETLRRQCATQIVAIDGREVRFTVSMGIASFPHTAADRELLLRASEAALDEAHRRGGNQVTLASIRLAADA